MAKAKQLRIGVYLGDYVPDVGGGYTFVSDVFNAFVQMCGESNHKFVVFCSPTIVREFKSRAAGKRNIEFCRLPKRVWWESARMALKRYSPLLRYFLSKPSRFECLAREKHVELVWFVGGDLHESVDIPYVGTVWDVQHRTHPWFPEVSTKGTWDCREAASARFLRRAAVVITGTKVGREQLGWYYQIPQERVKILPHPTPDFSAQPAIGSSDIVEKFSERDFILYPAQFWAHKNHVNLLKALKLLNDKYGLAVELVLTGADKGNREHVEFITESLDLSDRVHFLGFVSRSDLMFLYKKSMALVYPSFSGPENMPPLEAFAQSCPVAVANYPGADEQLGDAAIYFDPSNTEDIAEKLAKLLTDIGLREFLVAKGRSRAMRWGSKEYVEALMDVFDSFEPIRSCWGES